MVDTADVQSIRSALDQMSVPWDDPIRADAIEFAARDTDEKLLWLFIEQRRGKNKLEKSWRERINEWGLAGAWLAYVIFDQRDNLPRP